MREIEITMTSTAYVYGEFWSLWCHGSCTVVFLLQQEGNTATEGCTLPLSSVAMAGKL